MTLSFNLYKYKMSITTQQTTTVHTLARTLPQNSDLKSLIEQQDMINRIDDISAYSTLKGGAERTRVIADIISLIDTPVYNLTDTDATHFHSINSRKARVKLHKSCKFFLYAGQELILENESNSKIQVTIFGRDQDLFIARNIAISPGCTASAKH